jgi:monoamine oxidase
MSECQSEQLIKCDVVVVGAGLAGVIAAREICTSGLSVVLLEASDHVGGRTLTQTFEGVPEDLGAEFVQPSVHFQMLRELHDCGILLEAVSGENQEDSTEHSFDDIRLRSLFAQIDADSVLLSREELFSSELKGLDVSWEEYLTARESNPELVHMVKKASFPFSGALARDVSALYLLREVLQFGGIHAMFTATEARISGGTQALPLAIANQLPPGVLRLGHAVTRIAAQALGSTRVDTPRAAFLASIVLITRRISLITLSALIAFKQPN